jgi:cytochrome c oxidase cbb3-type subunit 3
MGLGSTAPEVSAAPPQPDEHGRSVYNFYCYQCHGYSGDAKTLAATFLNPPPRDFTHADPQALSRDAMREAVTKGRSGTAMVSFASVLDPADIEAVVDFIRHQFMQGDRPVLAYHTPENGWDSHEQRYGAAYPFANGDIPLDAPWEELTPRQRAGKKLYMSACIICHDRAKVENEGLIWELRALSYPRRHYSHTQSPDAVSGASPYALHDQPPAPLELTPTERRGERLFRHNCAFCHAADGTGRNWIGSFLEPRPRDLTGPVIGQMNDQQLRETIRDGISGTSMPAWKYSLSDTQIGDIMAYLRRMRLGDSGAANSAARRGINPNPGPTP